MAGLLDGAGKEENTGDHVAANRLRFQSCPSSIIRPSEGGCSTAGTARFRDLAEPKKNLDRSASDLGDHCSSRSALPKIWTRTVRK